MVMVMAKWSDFVSAVWLASGVLLQLSSVQAGCPERDGDTATYEGVCYEFISKLYYQAKAKEVCQEFGGHLVTISNRETQNWLESYIKRELDWVTNPDDGNGVWLGLERSSSNTWNWMQNGEKAARVGYENWDDMEPDPTESRLCAMFGDGTNDFKWRASLCAWYPYQYYVICQYDTAQWPFGSEGNLIGFCTGITVLVVALLAGLSIFYCYRKRKALMDQIHSNNLTGEFDSPSTIKKLNIDHLDCNIEENGSCDQLPPDYFGEVTNISESTTPANNFNFNIPIASNHERHKVGDKDLSLVDVRPFSSLNLLTNKPQYSRSVSAPAPSNSNVPQYYSSLASAPPLEEVHEGDNISFGEAMPLNQETITPVDQHSTKNSLLTEVRVTRTHSHVSS